MRVLAMGLLLASPWFAYAADPTAYAYVSSLQPPAWVEQNGQRTALTASDAILPGQHYSIGPNGRLDIAIADGSHIKFGENTDFELPSLQLEQIGTASVLKGALKISKGIFRYTAQASDFIQKRQLDLYIGNDLAVGLGNPDVIAQADEMGSSVCLLRGKIRVRATQQPELAMEQANSLFAVAHGQPPQTISTASPEQIKGWATQTDVDSNRPALQSNGAYSVLVAVYVDEPHARGIVANINKKGYPAILRSEKRDNTSVFDVLIEGLDNSKTAATYAEMLKTSLYVKNPRVLAPG